MSRLAEEILEDFEAALTRSDGAGCARLSNELAGALRSLDPREAVTWVARVEDCTARAQTLLDELRGKVERVSTGRRAAQFYARR